MITFQLGNHTIAKYQYSVLDLTTVLHASTCGTGDAIGAECALFMYLFLKFRLDVWHQGPSLTQGYDNAMKKLVEESVAEYELRCKAVDEGWLAKYDKEPPPPLVTTFNKSVD